MKFNFSSKTDLILLISFLILILTGAFLRFFKYSITPQTLEKASLILIPETCLVLLIFAIKIWRR